MPGPLYSNFQERVEQAAEAVLKRNGSVGPLELFQEMKLLQPCHLEGWRKGNEYYRVLQPWIQVGPEKFHKTIRHFQDWVKRRGLRPIEAAHTRRGPGGIEQLHVTEDGDPQREQFYRTYYTPADLPEKKTARLAAKLNRAPDLVVFEKVSDDGNCSECGVELLKGNYLLMEKGQALCLTCADLDRLMFLPAGDAALSRRSRKHSSLAAVVVRFNRKRKRYERQGLLVTEEALAKAEEECVTDAPARAAVRVRAALARQEEDREFVSILAQAILRRYPGCVADDARRIAEHTGRRSSGRVGRSAAGRALNASAVDRAVIAHIRHEHTNYDQLLMRGTARLDARTLLREAIDRVLDKWSGV
ncbi:MAG TPA: DUF2293 domain-containing protein [Verrucomicrobiae bacterium]|nr:DUF2293 domain-containing protein [Verrucomicrobiae bacterium]